MNAEPKMMIGTGGSPSYLQIARRGDIALGLKVLGCGPDPTGSPNRAYVACRIRSSAYKPGAAMEHAEQEENVVNLADSSLNFQSAWPELNFSKFDGYRASTIVGFFIRGNLHKEPLEVFKTALAGDQFSKLIHFITEKVGPAYLVLRPTVIVEWAENEIKPIIEQLEKKLAIKSQFDAETEDMIGVAGFQAHQLKLLFDVHKDEEEVVTSTAKIVKASKPEDADQSEDNGEGDAE
jgi:hypothetical protein